MPSHILVVDDERQLGELVARMLRQRGYMASVATSGAAALALLDGTQPYHLLVVDIRMPVMTGFEFAAAAQRRRPDLPVLFITGQIGPDYGGQGGFHDFLAKPFTAEELGAAVQRMLAPAEGP